MKLSTTDHDRAAAGLTYVYPVVSRRARGVSVGINLNPNNACNWRCIYCQVPDLVLGRAPRIDLARLEVELRALLGDIARGDFMAQRVPEGARRLSDVAFSGNGEPTSSPQLGEVIERVGAVLAELDLLGSIALVLITNGSLVHKPPVERALELLSGLGGEVWFKLDSATAEGARHIHSVPVDPGRQLSRLRRAAGLCSTWIQTCAFAWDGAAPSEEEQDAYCRALRGLVRDAVPVRGVRLYGLARPARQPEASRLGPLSREWLEGFARRIEAAGLPVQLSP